MSKNKVVFLIASLVMIASFFSSCDKSEGEGGKGKIIGTVYKIFDDGVIYRDGETYKFSNDTVIARNENVFIIYGNNQYGYDDKTGTSLNGTFQFKYLNEGDYTLYALSDLATGEKEPILYKAKVKDGGTTYAGTFYIHDGKNVGKCGVVGKVFAYYKEAPDWKPGVAIRVYIQKEGEATITNDTRSDGEGYYTFAKLDPNSTYQIFAETEPVKNEGIETISITIKTGAAGTITNCVENLYAEIK